MNSFSWFSTCSAKSYPVAKSTRYSSFSGDSAVINTRVVTQACGWCTKLPILSLTWLTRLDSYQALVMLIWCLLCVPAFCGGKEGDKTLGSALHSWEAEGEESVLLNPRG